MIFNDVKIGFYEYLIENKIIDEADVKESGIDANDISLFDYFSDFKNYLVEENYADTDIFTKTLSDLENMELVNGKLVSKNEDEEESENNSLDIINGLLQDESIIQGLDSNNSGDLDLDEISSFFASSSSDAPTKTNASEQSSAISSECKQLLEQIYADSNILKYIDEDGDGTLSEEEKAKFEAFVQNGNTELTLDDLQKAYDSMKDGTFDIDAYRDFVPTDKIPETETPDTDTPTTEASSQTQSSSYVPSSGSYSPTSAGNNTTTSEDNKKSLDKMTEAELQTELSSAQDSLSEKQDKLSDILNDSDPIIEAFKEAADEAYEQYQEQLKELDEDLAQQVDDLRNNITDKEKEISNKEQEISDKEVQVSESENTYNNAVSTRETLEASLSSLQAASAECEDDEQKAAIDAKITELQGKIKDAQAAEDAAKEAWDTADAELTTLNEEKEELVSGDGGLDKLNEQMENLEKEISDKYPEVQDLMDEYKDAQESYTSVKASGIESTKAEIIEAQDYINDIQTAITNLKNKDLQKQFKVSKTDNFFDDDVELTSEYVKHDGVMPYLVVGPEDPDPNTDYPVLVFLHGSGEFGTSESILRDSSLPYVLINGKLRNGSEVDLTNFNGYVIFPQANGGGWTSEQKLQDVHDVLDDFSQTHNIDLSHIALSGHSMGGTGAQYFAQYFNDYQSDYQLSKVSVISGYDSSTFDISKINVPMRGYNGSGDSQYMTDTFKNYVGEENFFSVNTSHGSVPEYSYILDSDGDGISDYLQWLFSDDD